MTWETFDADWDEQMGEDHADLPFTAAYTRDDGIRLELYTHDRVNVVECSQNTEILAKAGFVLRDSGPTLVPLVGDPEWITFWVKHPTIATAALRYAERTWLARKAEA